MTSASVEHAEHGTPGQEIRAPLVAGTGIRPAGDSSEVQYYARYFGDPLSRLFWHGGELYIGVLQPYGREFIALLKSPAFDALFADQLLMGLEEIQTRIDEFDLVFRLQRTPRIVYWHEWSPRMWRAGGLRLIQLLARLAEQGLTLRNPHPWNLLFDGKQFSYINPGSVVHFDSETFRRSYDKVARFFIRPLVLQESGSEHSARTLTSDVRNGVQAEDVTHLADEWVKEEQKLESQATALGFLADLLTKIEALQCNSSSHRWIDYFGTDCDFGPGTSWTRKQEVLRALLKDSSIRSVIDLGANTGHYARLAASQGREVIATDFDACLVDVIFSETQENGTGLYPAVLDFTHPTPGQGVNGGWFPPATERWKSDLVLCFALTHHMVFGKYRLDFGQIASGVRSFTRKWALVEYVPPRVATREWRPDAESWYSIETLATALRHHFSAVEVLSPARDERQLLVCGPSKVAL